MKKLVAFVLVLALLLTLSGCNTKQPGADEPAKTPTDRAYEVTVSYAGWCEWSKVYEKALNGQSLLLSSVRALPIYKFDTLTELAQFKTDVKDVLSLDQSYDEVPSFNAATAQYDESFFADNTLMLVYVSASSGSYRYGVESAYNAYGKFCVHVVQTNNPGAHTEDMAGWFITVAVPDSVIAECTEFDADLNRTVSNAEKWGVRLNAENVTPTGLTLVCSQDGGVDVFELHTGSYYVLQKLEGSVWMDLPYLPQEYEVGWTAVARIIQKNGTTKWDVNWEHLYGELPAGSYRIEKEITNFRGTGDYDKEMVYTGFTIE